MIICQHWENGTRRCTRNGDICRFHVKVRHKILDRMPVGGEPRNEGESLRALVCANAWLGRTGSNRAILQHILHTQVMEVMEFDIFRFNENLKHIQCHRK